MSSDHDESVDRPKESNEQPETETNSSSPPKKLHSDGTNEHAKPKRRGRRGKKRKQRKEGGGAACERQEECGSEDHPTGCQKHNLSWDSEEEDIELEDANAFSDVMIRPINVPKAPENSTQFIIDDHDECRLYMSFETPNPYLANYLRPEPDDSEIVEPVGEDAAYVDIDYEYESPHDFDNSAYYDREFELSYKNNRFDELLRLPRNDLISGLTNLENRLKDLNEELVKDDPNSILERLQSQLLELQEKHSKLNDENLSLVSYLEESGTAHPSNVVNNSEGKIDLEQDKDLEKADSCSNLAYQESGRILQDPPEFVREDSVSVCARTPRIASPNSIDCEDSCNKENACCKQERLQVSGYPTQNEPCRRTSVDSCSEHIPVKEKIILRDSEYHESQRCEEMPLSAVSEEHEMNVVAV